MRPAAISELKASLSEYLQHVKSGEEVIVTERGKAIARLVPYTSSGPIPAEETELIRAGLLRPPRKQPDEKFLDEFWKLPRPADPEGSVRKALLEEREEGWWSGLANVLEC